jgi:hypothetical protein
MFLNITSSCSKIVAVTWKEEKVVSPMHHGWFGDHDEVF